MALERLLSIPHSSDKTPNNPIIDISDDNFLSHIVQTKLFVILMKTHILLILSIPHSSDKTRHCCLIWLIMSSTFYPT